MNIQQAIFKLINKEHLNAAEMQAVMQQIMNAQATAAQIAAFLIAMRMKSETIEELSAAAKIMQQWMVPVEIQHPHLLDIVGTGGDGAHTFNVSTASSIVAAAAGAVVARHGNRSVTSTSGSANVLATAGVSLDLTAEQLGRCIADVGIGFIFAPLFHPATKTVALIRKELGVRTCFNLLGPLVNPAKPPHLLLGVFDHAWLMPMAQVALELGYQHVMIVHSEDGLDEISIAASTHVVELRQEKITSYTLTPQQFGLKPGNLQDIQVDGPQQSLQLIRDVLDNKRGAAREIVLLNAGAALYVADVVPDIESGIQKAASVLENGAAKKTFERLINWKPYESSH